MHKGRVTIPNERSHQAKEGSERQNSPEHRRQHRIRLSTERVVGEVGHHERPKDGYLPRYPYPHIDRRNAIASSPPFRSVEVHLRRSRVRVQDDALRDDGSIHEQLGQILQLRLEFLHACKGEEVLRRRGV